MYPFPTLSHAQLLNLARRAVEAADNHDPAHVEEGARQLFEALTDHVLAERPAFWQLAPGDARLLELGQERIVDLLLKLGISATHDSGPCSCSAIAEELLAELALQADDERRLLLAATD